MNAIVVAAGMGKRLKRFTRAKPKCLLEIDGVTIFERHTETLLKNGVSDINVVVGYKKELFTDKRFRYFVNMDYENNNILSSLFYAEEAMDGGFLFSYSDVLYDGVIVRQMLSSAADLAVAVDTNWIASYEGRQEHPIGEAELVFSRNGKTISEIRKGGDCKNAIGEFIGMACFSAEGVTILRSVFKELKDHYEKNPEEPFQMAKTFKQAYMTDMLQEITDRGYSVDIVKINGRWLEIDTPEDLEIVQKRWTGK